MAGIFYLTVALSLAFAHGQIPSIMYVPPGGGGGSGGGTTASTTQSPGGPSSTPSGVRDVTAECLAKFNQYRSKHGSRNLVYKTELQQIAQQCAEYYVFEATGQDLDPTAGVEELALVEKCERNIGNYGHQFGIIADSAFLENMVDDATSKWYNQKDGTNNNGTRYNYFDPVRDTVALYQDFTAMIWNATTEFACAISVSQNNNDARFFSVVYNPAGNIIVGDSMTQYVNNVGPPVTAFEADALMFV